MKNPFERLWEELHPNGTDEPVFKRVDADHPLDFYIGRDLLGDRLLMLLTDAEPEVFPPSKAMEVTRSQRRDGRWAVTFRLADADLANMFSYLCGDLVESSRQCPKENAASYVLGRYLRWKRLFERARTGLLSESTLRGLVGELLFLVESSAQYGYTSSVNAWMGPNQADQDYRFPDKWFEIKTIRPGATHVTISSLEQLDVGIEYAGELVLLPLDQANAEQPNSFTIVDIIDVIREALVFHPGAAIAFEEKLQDIGYADHPEYEQQWFTLGTPMRFEVTSDFPRLRRLEVALAIANATYQLDISALDIYQR